MPIRSYDIAWVPNPVAREMTGRKTSTREFSRKVSMQIRDFHRSLPGYQPTPLVSLDQLAFHLGVDAVWIKDESQRAGLNAFKVLGASYAMSWITAKQAHLTGPLSFSRLRTPELRRQAARQTFITATDGNHGRAVAWAAQKLGYRCVVFMPKGSSSVRLENIRRLGADASIIDGNYDDAVALAERKASENGWPLIQDTVRPGHEEIPLRVMQGYTTMFDEALEQLGGETPTHVFVQCGVGTYAAAGQAYLAERFGLQRPRLVLVEPTEAACFYLSIRSGGGKPCKVSGELNTIMAGLACGEPNPMAWEILRDYGDLFIACSDDVSRRGMRVLGNPLTGDERVVSGESGAVTLGLVYEILKRRDLKPLREAAGIMPESKILLFSTEGDTDPEIYREVVWGRDAI